MTRHAVVLSMLLAALAAGAHAQAAERFVVLPSSRAS